MYTWLQYDKDIKKLARKIVTDPNLPVENIYGVPRNGLVVAVHLSHLTNIPFTADKYQIKTRTMIVDDIVDSGETLLEMNEWCKKRKTKPYFVTLFYKPKSRFKPDLFGVKTSKWIIFPWETTKSSKYDRKR